MFVVKYVVFVMVLVSPCRWQWNYWWPRQHMVGLVSKSNLELYPASSGWIYEHYWGSHLKPDFHKFTVLDHPPCLLQVCPPQINHIAYLFLIVRLEVFTLSYKTVQKWSFYELGGELRLFFWMNSQVIVQNVTILAPLDSPNTDGIDPGKLSLPGWKMFTCSLWTRNL